MEHHEETTVLDLDQKSNPYVETKRKRFGIKRILLTVFLIVLSCAILIGYLYFPQYQSSRAYSKAIAYENELDYDKAVEYYSLVIPTDTKNYDSAYSKITELLKYIKRNKFVALAYVALRNQGYVATLNDMQAISVDTNCKFLTCYIDNKNYSISSFTLDFSGYSEYVQVVNDFETNLTIIAYNSGGSGFSGLISKALFDRISGEFQPKTAYIYLDLAQKYCERYDTTRDINKIK